MRNVYTEKNKALFFSPQSTEAGARSMTESITCITCGICFGLPDDYMRVLRASKRSFYCPNGHTMSYNESEEDRLRRERDLLKQQLAQKDDMIKAGQCDYLEARDGWDKAEREKLRIAKLAKAALLALSTPEAISEGMVTAVSEEYANIYAMRPSTENVRRLIRAALTAAAQE